METLSKNISLEEKHEKVTSSTPQSKQGNTEFAKKLLTHSATFWFIAVFVGQWLFFYYIMAFYGFSVIENNLQIWNRWEAMGSSPYKEGDTLGNTAFAFHAIGAGIVAFGGALQLIPKVRALLPKFHKINGYIYLITVLLLAFSGFYLSWIRDASPGTLSATGTTINGLLIIAFAYLTVKSARRRKLAEHRKWAIRLFLVSNAQWFLRVGTFSYMISGSLIGAQPAFGDPFFSIWTFGCFFIPLAVAQLYFYASERPSTKLKYLASSALITLTIFMSLGIFGLTPFLLQILSDQPITF
ncbi:DUF2306 domain-containing protein [Thalassotalea maritima]|uniref:DUF2306 domain-containing protein n=1 Tax=Thalassotalea maritima TaxID=3242416 RepID=UPI0035285B0A